MNKVVNFLDEIATKKSGIQIAKEKGNFFDDRNTSLKDDLENVVIIPKGFKVANDSATKVEDGVVIEDHEGNQFVWIPAKTGEGTVVHTTFGDKTMVYKRTTYSTNVATGEIDETTNSEIIKYSSSENEYFTEAMPKDEETSINANGGYYIGRYEAGDKETTEAKKMREKGASTTNTVTIKKNQAPYDYTTYAQEKKLAEGMTTARGYDGTTKLVSSYAWDTAISFMQIKNEDYGNSSEEGNYKNTTFKYNDITTEQEMTKNIGQAKLVSTGQTTPVCNIYDMGGNCDERTTESNSNSGRSYCTRGGKFEFYDYIDRPGGYRSYSNGGSLKGNAFRVTLFL